jgi:hypothetical protein
LSTGPDLRRLTVLRSQRGTGVGVCTPTIRVPASAGLTQWTSAKPEVYCAGASPDKTKPLWPERFIEQVFSRTGCTGGMVSVLPQNESDGFQNGAEVVPAGRPLAPAISPVLVVPGVPSSSGITGATEQSAKLAVLAELGEHNTRHDGLLDPLPTVLQVHCPACRFRFAWGR